MNSTRRVVLYYPERGDPKLGAAYSADLIPLEFLHICAPAMQAGFTFDIIDSMVEPDPMGKLWSKLPGAMAFGSTCIVGYQVADGTEVARQVRERYPQLPIIWGGWFPSVAPELFLRSNLADAVCLGQGELTFRDWLIAVRDGLPFDDIPGMALWRNGQLHKTPWREVISLDDLPAPRFDLIDVDQYLEIQERQASTAKVRYRFPDPPGFDMHNPYRALSYFSSYGCPEPCSFCCSPMVTQRRWKALAAETLVDRIEELKRTHDFDVLRFQDANFGVHEKRVKEFAQLLVDRKLNIWWNASIEVETIVKFSDETLDLLAESGCHMMWVGAETASAEMQAYIRKGIMQGNVDIAMRRMYERGISIGLFWIIGYPDETEESMRATLTLAAEIKTRYPSCTSEVLLYRPMPGTESGEHAARNGYEMPLEFETWGSMVDYKFANRTFEALPPSIKRDYHRYTYLVPWFDGLVRGKTLYHRFLRVMAGWRLRHQIYDYTLEFKAYDIARRIGLSMGIVRAPKLENRAAGVTLEGTTHNVRDAATMPQG